MPVQHVNDVPATPVKAGDQTTIQVLLQGPNFAMRRFVMQVGGGMPEHTNTVEHEQYVLRGKARISIDGEEFDVQAGDVVFIPEGVAHWYQNRGEENFEFLCMIPNKPDEVRLVVKDGC
jgi:quercetin dioxygenase-like cupin family protein